MDPEIGVQTDGPWHMCYTRWTLKYVFHTINEPWNRCSMYVPRKLENSIESSLTATPEETTLLQPPTLKKTQQKTPWSKYYT